MPKKNILAALAALIAVEIAAYSYGCSGRSNTSSPTGGLRPESELIENICNFPAQNFSPSNKLGSPRISLTEGDYAVDFTLKDTSGNTHKLSDYLAYKPVLLVFASIT